MRWRDYPGLSRWLYYNHKSSYKIEAEDAMMEAEVPVMPLLGGNQEPRNSGGLWKLEKTRNRLSLGASRKSPALLAFALTP